jgi:ATP-dependent Clp protease adapter protein ClpS
MTVYHTWHYLIYTLSSIWYYKRNDVPDSVSISVLWHTNGAACAEICPREGASYKHPTSHTSI